MSINRFADTISYTLKQPQIDQDISSTLKSIKTITYQYHDDDINNIEIIKGFFKKISPKIQFLFWLSQNVENKYVFEQLLDIFEQFDSMKQRYKETKANNKKSLKNNNEFNTFSNCNYDDQTCLI